MKCLIISLVYVFIIFYLGIFVVMVRALVVIDVQNDFCSGGALAVSGGEDVVGFINGLIPSFAVCVLTQDWHPLGHSSFASSHAGYSAYDVIDLSYGEQVLWPDHCVQGSYGAEFRDGLRVDLAHCIIRKGFRLGVDSYSAFRENDRVTETGLAGYLRGLGVRDIVLVGLATDYCVYYSAMDGVEFGFGVSVELGGCRGLDVGGSLEGALAGMRGAGVSLKN